MTKSKRIWGTLDPFYEVGPVLGRKVANTQFLGALFMSDPFDEYHFFLPDRRLSKTLYTYFEKTVPAFLDAQRIRLFDRRELPEKLHNTDYYCFHLSDCITTQPAMARLRNKYSQTLFPITGLIHSLSYSDFANPFLRHLWPGTTARDAIICSSSYGAKAVSNIFAWLREEYALSEETHRAPLLARLPLGVDTGEYRPASKEVSKKEVVRILVFGRISHHSKMDILPLIRTIHRLFTDGLDPETVELVLAGWADDTDDFLPTLRDYMANVGIRSVVQLRPTEEEKKVLFQSADIFVSIADNPQETFGITLIEAGAFGLPVIASEYDGYRDIVIHGETGMLVPTLGAGETPDVDVLAPVTFDNQYHLMLSQRTAISIPALADALLLLIKSPEKRRVMGKAARKHIVSNYAWHHIIKRYCHLWEKLWESPVDQKPLRSVNHSQCIPYGRIFGHFTTGILSHEMELQAGRTGDAFYRGKDFPTLYSGMQFTIHPDIAKKMVFFARKPIQSVELKEKLRALMPELDDVTMDNHILWALKHDVLELVSDYTV